MNLPSPPAPPPLQVGRIYQQFSCLEEGRVQNIIEATLPPPPLPLLAGADLAVTLVVEAGYEARTARSIALSFRCGCGGREGTIGSFLAASWRADVATASFAATYQRLAVSLCWASTRHCIPYITRQFSFSLFLTVCDCVHTLIRCLPWQGGWVSGRGALPRTPEPAGLTPAAQGLVEPAAAAGPHAGVCFGGWCMLFLWELRAEAIVAVCCGCRL